MELTAGAVIAGRYRAERRVGAGGMGEVWKGENLTIGTPVALKILLSDAAVHHEVVARFQREAYLLGRVRSDHVARVLDFVEDPEVGQVIVMEFVEGESLAEVLDRGSMTVEEAVDLSLDLSHALNDLHRAKIVHRDLKPGNLIMQPLTGGRLRAVVVDFGISRLLARGDDEEETITGITKANMALGTVEYMAPEQVLNSRDVTPVSDIYAVGAILYRALTGGHAFGSKTEDELARAKLVAEAPRISLGRADRVASALTEVVSRAIRRRPKDRYASASELLAAVLAIADLVKVSELDLDGTTADGTGGELVLPTPPGPKSSAGAVTSKTPLDVEEPESADTKRQSLISEEELERSTPTPRSAAASIPDLAAHALPPPGGVPKGIVLAAVLAAFAVGAAVALAVMPEQILPDGQPPSVEPMAATPARTAAPVAPPTDETAALASARIVELLGDDVADEDEQVEPPPPPPPPPPPQVPGPMPQPPPPPPPPAAVPGTAGGATTATAVPSTDPVVPSAPDGVFVD